MRVSLDRLTEQENRQHVQEGPPAAQAAEDAASQQSAVFASAAGQDAHAAADEHPQRVVRQLGARQPARLPPDGSIPARQACGGGTHRLHTLLNVIDLVLEEAGESAAAERTRQAATDAATETEPEAGEASEVTDAGNEDDRLEPASVFSGRLTEFEAFSEAERAAILQRLVALDIFEDLVPEPVFHMLGMYPDAPGSWLLQPWRDRGAAVDPQVAEQTLGRILTEAGPQQGTLATRTKILVCNRWGHAGRMHVPAHMAEEFNGWPYPDEKIGRAHV